MFRVSVAVISNPEIGQHKVSNRLFITFINEFCIREHNPSFHVYDLLYFLSFKQPHKSTAREGIYESSLLCGVANHIPAKVRELSVLRRVFAVTPRS